MTNAKMEKINLLHLPTPLHRIVVDDKNTYYMKRDDLTNFALGGNKTRKVEFFLKEAINRRANVLVTYGSFQSNHCRVVAAVAALYQMKCVLILSGGEDPLRGGGNGLLIQLSGADVVVCSNTEEVAATIEQEMQRLQQEGYSPYFIPGGGHSLEGVEAYVDAFMEIQSFEKEHEIRFHRIYVATGTGTTQGGLIAGKLITESAAQIVGLSIARTEEQGRGSVTESVCQKLPHVSIREIDPHVFFIDRYRAGGYGKANNQIYEEIQRFYKRNAILLDPTYTGKAFYGMRRHIVEQDIQGENILFVHTGGLPVFFGQAESIQSFLQSPT